MRTALALLALGFALAWGRAERRAAAAEAWAEAVEAEAVAWIESVTGGGY
jgi:hypothetical protein